jgi:hypothetical protein
MPKKRLNKAELASVTDNARLVHNYVQSEPPGTVAPTMR